MVIARLGDPVGPVRERIESSPYGYALVTSDGGNGGTILGRLRRSRLDVDPATPAEAVMEPGPSTFRPDLAVDELRERLDKRDLRTAVVSTPEGRLLGIVRRADL